MTVDWGFATILGGVGFGTVFVVLIILMVAMWLVGLVFSKISTGKDQTTTDSKKGA